MIDGPGHGPMIRHHFSNEITLVSPSDADDTVTLKETEEKLFALSRLKELNNNGCWINSNERNGDIRIVTSTFAGISIRRRGTNKECRFLNFEHLQFLIDVLDLILDPPKAE